MPDGRPPMNGSVWRPDRAHPSLSCHAKRFLHVRCLPILNQNHQLLPHHDLHRPNTNMGFRRSFLRPFKKLKGKLWDGSSERDGGGRSGSEDSRRGGEDRREGRNTDVKGGGIGQRNLYLHSGVGVGGTMGGGPSAEGNGFNGKKVALSDATPPTSTPSISHIGKPDSMRTISFLVLPLI